MFFFVEKNDNFLKKITVPASRFSLYNNNLMAALSPHAAFSYEDLEANVRTLVAMGYVVFLRIGYARVEK